MVCPEFVGADDNIVVSAMVKSKVDFAYMTIIYLHWFSMEEDANASCPLGKFGEIECHISTERELLEFTGFLYAILKWASRELYPLLMTVPRV